MNDSLEKVGVEAILELTGTDREAKAYAFLYAALRRTEISKNPVRDVVDCLVPFTAPYINRIAGKQVASDGLKKSLKTDFGFDIPLYAIDQLMPALQKAGYVEYHRSMGVYIAKRGDHDYEIAKTEIADEFDQVVSALEKFAAAVGYEQKPPSGSWADALIQFLKTSVERADAKVINIKGALLDPTKIESALVGAFIKKSYESSELVYSNILKVFMGILVEEFISSVSEIGTFEISRPVYVFYDTAVLLRLLGCSGKLLRTATEELNRYLQDLGFKIHYLSGNEAEVAGILQTIIHVKDSGGELEGETADAIASGDVNIVDIRMLQHNFNERLAAMGVFPAENIEKSAFDNAQYQIDERGFSEYLKQNARKGGRSYGFNNRENDAGYLGTVMRLRRRLHTSDLAACGFIFVTSNKFLANMSRRYLIEQKTIRSQHCPPILSVGQMATILWLIKDQALVPEKAGRELLANCYAAFRPDQQWFKLFREGIERTVGNVEEFVKVPNNALVLQAARRIAQEESFGESSVVRELNMAEILSRADVEMKRRDSDEQARLRAQQEAATSEQARIRREAEEESIRTQRLAEAERVAAIELAKLESSRSVQREFREALEQRSALKADKILKFWRNTLILMFSICVIYAFYKQFYGMSDKFYWSVSLILLAPAILSFADLVGVKIVQHWSDKLRRRIIRYFAE